MFLTTLYFIPCIVSLLWFFSFLFKTKNQRQWLFVVMLVVEVFYYAATAVYLLPNTDYNVLVRMDAVCVPIVFVLVAMLMLYMYMLQPKRTLRTSHLLLLFPAAILGALINLMYFLLGFDNTARLVKTLDDTGSLSEEFNTELYKVYVYLDGKFVGVILLIFSFLFIIYSLYVLNKEGYKFGSLYRFIAKKAALRPSLPKGMLVLSNAILLLPYGILGRRFMSDHVFFTSLMMLFLAVVKHLICHLEYNTTDKAVTIHELTHIQVSGFQEKAVEVNPPAANAPSESAAHLLKSEILGAKFIKEMEEGAYKDESLSLQTMADKLGVSTRTLSNLVNNDFGLPFRDVVNKYRIEAAKQYLTEHPDATQSTVAFECGFKNDSVFNKKFKEIEGVTPLMWITHKSISESN